MLQIAFHDGETPAAVFKCEFANCEKVSCVLRVNSEMTGEEGECHLSFCTFNSSNHSVQTCLHFSDNRSTG